MPGQPSRQHLLQDPWIRHQHIRNSFIAAGQLEWSSAFFPLCGREADVLPCREELISRLQANSASKCTIARVVKANPWPEKKVPRGSDVSSVLWAAFGFHPGLQRELSHAFCRVLGGASCGLVRETWPLFPDIRIAWKNTLPSHHTHVMRCMESVEDGGDGTV